MSGETGTGWPESRYPAAFSAVSYGAVAPAGNLPVSDDNLDIGEILSTMADMAYRPDEEIPWHDSLVTFDREIMVRLMEFTLRETGDHADRLARQLSLISPKARSAGRALSARLLSFDNAALDFAAALREVESGGR